MGVTAAARPRQLRLLNGRLYSLCALQTVKTSRGMSIGMAEALLGSISRSIRLINGTGRCWCLEQVASGFHLRF